MRPGGDCIGCHAGGEGPRFQFAGTVMSSLHDEDDCLGVGAVRIDILDRSGNVAATMTSNDNGNFFSDVALTSDQLPFRARLTAPDGTTTQMSAPQQDGDCMSCHTQTGHNGAPGRIVAP